MFDQQLLCGRRFVVCGEFNCPGAGGNQLDASLVDVLQRYNLVQHVGDATRDGGNTLEPFDDADRRRCAVVSGRRPAPDVLQRPIHARL